MNFWIMTIIFTVLIIGISLIFKNKKPVMLLIPVVVSIGSIFMLIASFFIGRWEGMGIGFISISLLISSAAALIVVGLFGVVSFDRKRDYK
ncbi:YesK family protein [Terribacillus saccharophilus]|uniref:YesK family protein n=1 Tax=Terribacillus saccharophilus TaxID=361277 RepID=UPI003982803D